MIFKNDWCEVLPWSGWTREEMRRETGEDCLHTFVMNLWTTAEIKFDWIGAIS